MFKARLFTVLILIGVASAVFAQQTEAPDQGTVGSDTNSAVSSASSQADQVTEEKEVVAAEGVVYNDGKIDFASSDVKFVINAKDTGSGVKSVAVLVDDSQFGVYENPIGFALEGKHLIAYKVEDNVGNISGIKYYEFMLDKTAPAVSITSDKKYIKLGEVVYVSSNYNFGIYAQDALSGVKAINYTIDGASETVYDKPFAAIGTNGLHKVEFNAVDNVGNVAEKQALQFFVDSNAPVLDFVIEPNVYEKDGVNYISGSALIKIAAKDAETGLAKIVYTIDGGAEMDYLYPIKLSAGVHSVKAKAIDLLGNVSEEKALDVTVDSELPEADLVPTK